MHQLWGTNWGHFLSHFLHNHFLYNHFLYNYNHLLYHTQTSGAMKENSSYLPTTNFLSRDTHHTVML